MEEETRIMWAVIIATPLILSTSIITAIWQGYRESREFEKLCKQIREDNRRAMEEIIEERANAGR